MQRRILSVGVGLLGAIVGLAVGMVVIEGVELVNVALWPPPPGLDVHDTAAMKYYVGTLPISAFLLVLVAHGLGSLIGGGVATLIAGRRSVLFGMLVGAVLMAGGIVTVLQISHPVWFSLLDMLVYMPAAYMGSFLLVKRSEAVVGPS